MKYIVIATLALFPLIYNQCGPAVFSKVSKQEANSLTQTPFAVPAEPFNPNKHPLDDGIATPDDSLLPTENLRIDDSSKLDSWVKNCGPEKYDKERAEAIALAKANRNLIPVQYSISFGSALDQTAWYAHRRAILHADDDGITPVVVAPANSLAGEDYNGANSFHYIADHSEARRKFIRGERCFFSVIDVSDPNDKSPPALRGSRSINQSVRVDHHGSCAAPDFTCNNRAYDHTLALLYYGDAYPTTDAEKMSPRLFKKLGPLARDEEPQIIPLYVADFREPLFGIPEKGPVIRKGFESSAIRRHEYAHCLRDILDMPLIYKYRWLVTWNLSKPRIECSNCSPCAVLKAQGKECYSKFDRLPGMEGVPQLLHNIFLASMDGIVLPLQYTPIILDLGRRGIVTSSLEWGTFFNLNKQKVEIQRTNSPAGTKPSAANLMTPLKTPGPHLTAWLGGRLENHQRTVSFGSEFNSNWVRKAEDGFLVTLDEKGSVSSGQNLFGDHTVVDGESFGNGFLALRKFAKKRCDSPDIKARYVGPWDGTLYTKTLKVWVDTNRNGISEEGELLSLAEARVGAINTCYIEHRQNEDAYGNKTALRAAFLYLAAGEQVSDDEIVNRIDSGKTSAGHSAEFRAAVDVFFKAMPSMTLLPKLLFE